MATLNTLQLGTFTNVSNTAVTGTEPVLQEIAGASDTTNVHDTSNTTHTGTAQFTLEDVNADLGNVDTLFVQLRYANSGTPGLNTWDSLSARVFKSDATTPLTNALTVISGPITTTTPTNSSVAQFTGVDTAATKDDWDAAVVQISFAITKSMAGDAIEERVFAAELTGTYTVAAAEPNEGSASGAVAWVGTANGETVHSGAGTGAIAWAGSATGEAPTSVNEGAGSGTVTWAGTADGMAVYAGDAAGTVTWSGTADGMATSEGTASGSVTWAGTADGETVHEGDGSGTVTWAGSATGQAPTGENQGAATGTITWAGSVDGTTIREGSTTGTITWAGSSTGTSTHVGLSTGTVTWVGSATGETPTVGDQEGSGTGTITWAGTATGSTTRQGLAVGAVAWVGLAVGGVETFWSLDPVAYTAAPVAYTPVGPDDPPL